MPTPTHRRLLRALATASVLVTASALVTPAQAGSLARVDVYDRTAGEALPLYRHHGRQYVEGRPGNEYAVRIRNTTGERLLAVLSVDGVNAVTGDTASPDQAGYVIEPWGYVTVQGWRKDLDGTAAFYFSDPHDSYASRTGRPADLGVIGVALFRERPFEREPGWSRDRDFAERSSAAGKVAGSPDAAAPAAESRAGDDASVATQSAQPSLGTGHGRREYSPAERVAFERASRRPAELLTIRYERREALVAMGVLSPDPYDWREPEPFPGALGFVPDP
jgi:hypothetical protein